MGAELFDAPRSYFLSPRRASRRPPTSPLYASRCSARAIRFARTCYDHLAGTVGVVLTERLVECELLAQFGAAYLLTAKGSAWLTDHAINAEQVAKSSVSCGARVDWSERRCHVAGAFGAVLADWRMTQAWLCRVPNSRALRLTEAGRADFAREWDLCFD